ncbi:MAG: M20/M25/M40 family metallo-hydrolase, partial [Bacteroidetes bacterium]|nr:M20/M25/M40 family metallo-hydrolase [Bacteroidota bacterium]
MIHDIQKLQPERLWRFFLEICKIPRPSKKEEKIAAYIREFAHKHKLECILDNAGNVLVRKPASPGYENRPGVILQSHLDMVCEKNSDTIHDFDRDPVTPWIDDNWIKAKGTTLGADDGIGIAAALAILESDDIQHGPLEALFTMDEETGLTGAFALKPDQLRGRILLNLDSEDEGQIFIGCAGGKDTVATMPMETEAAPENHIAFKASLTGLKGGHSGDD